MHVEGQENTCRRQTWSEMLSHQAVSVNGWLVVKVGRVQNTVLGPGGGVPKIENHQAYVTTQLPLIWYFIGGPTSHWKCRCLVATINGWNIYKCPSSNNSFFRQRICHWVKGKAMQNRAVPKLTATSLSLQDRNFKQKKTTWPIHLWQAATSNHDSEVQTPKRVAWLPCCSRYLSRQLRGGPLCCCQKDPACKGFDHKVHTSDLPRDQPTKQTNFKVQWPILVLEKHNLILAGTFLWSFLNKKHLTSYRSCQTHRVGAATHR